jgi:hypothetical protein
MKTEDGVFEVIREDDLIDFIIKKIKNLETMAENTNNQREKEIINAEIFCLINLFEINLRWLK